MKESSSRKIPETAYADHRSGTLAHPSGITGDGKRQTAYPTPGARHVRRANLRLRVWKNSELTGDFFCNRPFPTSVSFRVLNLLQQPTVTLSQTMNRSTLLSLLTGAAMALTANLNTLFAQNDGGNPGGAGGQGGGRRGNFDPAQMRQRMMERFREQLGVKDDAEWGVIEGRINKVNDLRFSTMGGRGFGGRGPGGQGGQGGPGGQRGPGGFGGQANPEAEALQKALDGGASADDIKAKLTAYRASQKEKEAQLEKAQNDLRQLLSVKQEAAAVLMGLLK